MSEWHMRNLQALETSLADIRAMAQGTPKVVERASNEAQSARRLWEDASRLVDQRIPALRAVSINPELRERRAYELVSSIRDAWDATEYAVDFVREWSGGVAEAAEEASYQIDQVKECLEKQDIVGARTRSRFARRAIVDAHSLAYLTKLWAAEVCDQYEIAHSAYEELKHLVGIDGDPNVFQDCAQVVLGLTWAYKLFSV